MTDVNSEAIESLSSDVEAATLTISDVILSTNSDVAGAFANFLGALKAPNGVPDVTPSNADIVRSSADYYEALNRINAKYLQCFNN